MAMKDEGDPRYRQMLDVVRADSTHETLPGVYWVVCPEHGVGQAVRVVQWTRELSDEIHSDTDKKWFIRGRYTSGNCSSCGMTLSVTRRKPRSK